MALGRRRMLGVLTGTVVAGYAALALAARLKYRSLLYPAPAPSPIRAPAGARLERIERAAGDVWALYRPAPSAAPTLVHFHGNGEDLGDQVQLAHALGQRGLGFFAVEYPGYGPARDQQPSESSIYAAAEAAIGRLRELGVSRDQTVLMGMSLGSGVAAEMAVRGHGARLVLIAPYTSIPDVARRVAPFLPVSWIMSDRFDTASKAERLALPALILHGSEDELIPHAMGRELAERLPHARMVTLDGGHHGDLFMLHGERMYGEIARFCLER